MSDKKVMRRKERKEREADDVNKDGKELKKEKEGEDDGKVPAEPGAAGTNDLQVEALELPPFEIITGDRIDPFTFKFQFKNVEYSSGRNKTFLCFLVDDSDAAAMLQRGYLEDEHAGQHAEEAFFTQCLTHCDPNRKYTVTWYVSSSPCAACAAKVVEVLTSMRNLRLSIFASRLFEWEEPEIQAGLKALHAAGCKLRVMKPLDFSYTWETFVENQDEALQLWDDCKENYEYYHDKLSDLLQ